MDGSAGVGHGVKDAPRCKWLVSLIQAVNIFDTIGGETDAIHLRRCSVTFFLCPYTGSCEFTVHVYLFRTYLPTGPMNLKSQRPITGND